MQTLEKILTSQRILLAKIMLKCSYRTRDLKFDERTGKPATQPSRYVQREENNLLYIPAFV